LKQFNLPLPDYACHLLFIVIISVKFLWLTKNIAKEHYSGQKIEAIQARMVLRNKVLQYLLLNTGNRCFLIYWLKQRKKYGPFIQSISMKLFLINTK